MKLQSTRLKALFQHVQQVVGLGLTPTMHQSIIGIPTPGNLWKMLCKPFVKDVMQKQVSQQRANDAPYNVAKKGRFHPETYYRQRGIPR